MASIPKSRIPDQYERGLRKILSEDKKPQSQKFIDKAKELGCDEDEAAFEARLRGIAKAKPAEKPKPKKPAKRDAKADR